MLLEAAQTTLAIDVQQLARYMVKLAHIPLK
jgi:hypothetical protein